MVSSSAIFFGAAAVAAEVKAADEQVVICKIVSNRSNIFENQKADAGAVQAAQIVTSSINRFHTTTRESVILREAGVKPGDTVSVGSIEDIERRLRRLRLFASVNAKLITNDGCVELHLTTRDNFSIVAGASGSYLGGVGNVGVTFGEKNLLGSGNKLLASVKRSSTGEFRGSLSFSDLHFLDNDWRATYRIGRTNEGDFYGFSLSDAFRSLSDKREWKISADRVEKDIKYFSEGNTVVAIPVDQVTVGGRYIWRSGSGNKYWRRGAVVSFDQSDYSAIAVTDNNVLSIDAPADRKRFYIGGLIARDNVDQFMKLQGLDTLNFVQDLSLGSSAELQLGVSLIDEEDTAGGQTDSTDPSLSLALRKSLMAGDHTLLKYSLTGRAIFEEGGARPWSSTGTLKAFYTKHKRNTLAMRLDYTTGEDGTGLPSQLTLGENNGLRGYDARQFDGNERWRLNLESRARPGWQLGVLDIGLTGFFDAGLVETKGASSETVRRSVGAGVRIASNSILGARVIRIDVAKPLDAPATESADLRLSIAVGQVFRF